MRKFLSATILGALVVLLPALPGYALDSTLTSSVSVTLQSVFSAEFYTDANVIYSGAVPFSNIDPAKTVVLPDGRSDNDGKSDTGVVCKSNLGMVWYFKMHLEPTAPLPAEKVRYYVSQPWNRNTGDLADGSLSQGDRWVSFATTPNLVYTSGATDISNLPFGTLITFSFSITPEGLQYGQTYTANVVYTLTTAQ